MTTHPSTPQARTVVLSTAQRQWLANNDQARGVIPVYLRTTGTLDRVAVHRAYEFVVARHAPLTMRLTGAGDALRQVLGDPTAVRPPEWTTAAPPDVVAAVREFASVPMDLTRGEAFRLRVVDLGGDEHLVLFNMHHLYADGWGIKLVLGDFWRSYHAFVKGEPIEPVPPERSYADFVAEEQDAGATLTERQREFWTTALTGNTATALTAGPDHSGEDRSRYHEVCLESAELRAVQVFAREANATVSALLLATFLLALRERTGQDDLTITFMISGREDRRHAHTLGLFARRIPLRFRMDPARTVAEFARSVMRTWSSAAANSRPPYSTQRLRTALDLHTVSFGRTTTDTGGTPISDIEVFVNFPVYPDFGQYGDAALTVTGIEMNRQRPVVHRPRLMLSARWATVAVISALYNEQFVAPEIAESVLSSFARLARGYPGRSVDTRLADL